MSRKNYNSRKKKPVLTCFVCGTKRYGAAALAKHLHAEHLPKFYQDEEEGFGRQARVCWCGWAVFDATQFRKHLKSQRCDIESHFLACLLVN